MIYGLIGEKLSHSFSKLIHEQIADYHYDLIELNKDEFHNFMKEKSFKAINVTIPYKKAVIPYLDEIDDDAKLIGAVNTIVNDNGKLKGYNSDYLGFQYTCDKYQIDMKDKKILIIGNGGAAAAIKVYVQKQKPKQMIIVKANKSDETITYDELYQKHLDVDIMINTSPVGMYPNINESPLDLDKFDHVEAIIDIIYNPLLTKLTLQAKRKKIKYCNGLEMLIAQAKYAVEYFLNKSYSDDLIEQIYDDLMKQRKNIVFIGMPSCGKTTISKMLSEQLKMPLYDIDEEIIKKCGCSIPEIFQTQQESGFRKIETQVTYELAKLNGVVISCGGGIIKNKINMDLLSLNGIIFFIDRSLDKLIYSDSNRPLSSSKEALQKLYDERIDLYRYYSDYIIENNDTIESCIKQIVNKL